MSKLAVKEVPYVSLCYLSFLTLQLAPSVGTDTASFGLSGGYRWIECRTIYQTPEESPSLEITRAGQSSGKEAARATTRSCPNGLKNPPLLASNRAVDTTIGILIIRSEERREEQPHRRLHAPPRAGGSSGVPSHAPHAPECAQRVSAHAKHTPARAKHMPGTRLARHLSRTGPDQTGLEPDRTRTEPNPDRTKLEPATKKKKKKGEICRISSTPPWIQGSLLSL